MRDINEYGKRGIEMLESIGIKCGDVARWDVNTRAKKRLGQCEMVGKRFIIEINKVLLDESIDEDALMNTVLHELLHTCKDCFCHTGRWKVLAEKVNDVYGTNIKRTTSSEEKGVHIDVPKRVVKYEVKCPKCGYVWKRTKMSKIIKNPQKFRCNDCNEKLIRVM